MKSLTGYVEAFRKLESSLSNPRNLVSAKRPDGNHLAVGSFKEHGGHPGPNEMAGGSVINWSRNLRPIRRVNSAGHHRPPKCGAAQLMVGTARAKRKRSVA